MMSNEIRIPFVDLAVSNWEQENDLLLVFKEVLRTGVSVGGPFVKEFERAFAEFCGVKHCVGVNSGTDGLRFALMAAGVEKGDGVITVPNTFIATTEAISQSGAIPHFVDVNSLTSNISIDALSEYLETGCYICQDTGLPIDRANGRHIKAIIP